nr:hypothetical protein [Tanacetum cinerariifolium]
MPPRMRTRSAGRPAVESLGGGTGVWVGRGGKGRSLREGNDERVDDLNGQGNDQGMGANGGVEGVNKNVEEANEGAPDFSTIIAQQLQNLLPAMLAQVGNQNGNMKMENVQDMSGCSIDQKVKYTAGSFVGKALTWWNSRFYTLSREVANHAMVGAGHAAYTDRFHELARLVPHLVTPESRKIERYVYGLALQIRGMVAAAEPKTMQKAVQISSALTDEAVRNGSIKKVKKRGNMEEPSNDKNGRDDNKRTRTMNVFATTMNPDCRGKPRNVNHVNARNPPVIARYECGCTNHVRLACPRLNRAQRPEENRPNQVAANKRVRVVKTKGTKLGLGGNGYSRKRQKQSKKRQNRARNGKDQKRQSHSKPKVKSQSPRSTKVNPGKVKVKPGKAEAEKAKKIQFNGPKISNP